MDKRTRAKFTTLIAKIEALDQSASAGVSLKGVPAGGEQGQMLVKKSDADYSTEWVDRTIPEAITNLALENICKL